jgi:hypothetical protein
MKPLSLDTTGLSPAHYWVGSTHALERARHGPLRVCRQGSMRAADRELSTTAWGEQHDTPVLRRCIVID